MHRVRRRLREPRAAGPRSAAFVWTKRWTSEGDSILLDMTIICHMPYIHVKETITGRTAWNTSFDTLFRFSQQKLARVSASLSLHVFSITMLWVFSTPTK